MSLICIDRYLNMIFDTARVSETFSAETLLYKTVYGEGGAFDNIS